MAAFTTNGSGAMNWSSGARWTNTADSTTGTVPGSGDTATVATGHTVTLDQDVTDLAGLEINGDLSWSTLGKTLRMAGNVQQNNPCVVTWGPGGVLEFDNVGRTWQTKTGWGEPYTKIQTSGTTTGARFTVRSDSGGTNAQFLTQSGYAGPRVGLAHVDYLRVGTATTYAIHAAGQAPGSTITLDDLTFEACGDVKLGAAPWTITGLRFTNSVGVSNLELSEPGASSLMDDCVFELPPYIPGNGATYTNSYFHRAFNNAFSTTRWALFDGNLVRQPGNDARSLYGPMTNTLWLVDTDHAPAVTGTATSATSTTLVDASQAWVTNAYNAANPSWLVVLTGGTGAGQTRKIYSNTATALTIASPPWGVTPDATTTYAIVEHIYNPHQAGLGIDVGLGGGAPVLITDNAWWSSGFDGNGECLSDLGVEAAEYHIFRNLFLRNAGLNSPGDIASLYNRSGKLTIEHNTFFTADQALIQHSEGGETPAGSIRTLRSNIAWCDPTMTAYWAFGPRFIADVIHHADVSLGTLDVVAAGMADYNCGYGLKAGLGGVGYESNFSVAPGAHDLFSTDPQFVNVNANPLTWAVAQAATSSESPITQMTDMLAYVRDDPSRTKLSLLPYLRAAYTPTNAALATAAHDGTTIGAVAIGGVPVTPITPSSLTATATSFSQIDLAWSDNSSDETGFVLERSLDGSTGWAQISTPAANATTYNDTGLSASTTYYYQIKAVNGVGPSAFAATATATTQAAPTIPTAPSDLTATATSFSQIDLAWSDNSSDETGFAIERSLDGSTGWSQINAPAANTTTYSDTVLSASTAYYYRVKAVNSAGSSAFAATATATTLIGPDANSPTDLQAVSPSDFEVFLTWERANDDETAVLVERSGNGGTTWNTVATLPAGENLWFDRSLWPGTAYLWRIKVEIGGGESNPSESVSATTMTSNEFRSSENITNTLTLPTDAAATNLDRWTNSITWTDPNTANRGAWEIFRSTDGGLTYQPAVMTPNINGASSWTDRYLTPGTTYHYRMRVGSSSYGISDCLGPLVATTPALGVLPTAATTLCSNTYQVNLGGASSGTFTLSIRDGLHGGFTATTPPLAFDASASTIRDALRTLCLAWTDDRNLLADAVVSVPGSGSFLIGLTDGALLIQGDGSGLGGGSLTVAERQTATNTTLLWEDQTGGSASYKVETGNNTWPTDATYDAQFSQVGTTATGVCWFNLTTVAEAYCLARVRPNTTDGDGGYCEPTAIHTPSAGSPLTLTVGPGETYTSLGTVPWETVGPGSVISVAYDTYHELIMVGVRGTLTRPIVIQGVMNGGNRPVLNGVGATTNAQFKSGVYDGFGVLMVLNRNLSTGFYGTLGAHGWCAGNLLIKNLELTGAYRGDSGGLTCTNSEGASVAYDYAAAGLYCAGGENLYFDNIYVHGNGNGIFGLKGSSGSDTLSDSVSIPGRNVVIRNSVVNSNGNPGHPYEHGVYFETNGLLAEGNRFGPAHGGGNAVKTRSDSLVFRYNVVNGSGPGAHLLDLVDAENHKGEYFTLPDAQKEDWIYGNSIYNPPLNTDGSGYGSASPVHVGGDSGVYTIYKRVVRWYANTYLIRRDTNQAGGYLSAIFWGQDQGYGLSTRAAIDARRNIFHAIPDQATAAPMAMHIDWVLGYYGRNTCVTGWTSGITHGLVAGLSNIVTIADPDFADVTSNPPDLRPTTGSPCIDAATGSLARIRIDRQPAPLSTLARSVVGPAPDLGAYEFMESVTPPPDEPPPDEPPPAAPRYRQPAKWVRPRRR